SVLLTWMARSADSSILTGIGAAWAIDAHAKAERQASIDRRGVAGFIAENSSERTGRRIDCRRQNNRCIKLDRRLARAGLCAGASILAICEASSVSSLASRGCSAAEPRNSYAM